MLRQYSTRSFPLPTSSVNAALANALAPTGKSCKCPPNGRRRNRSLGRLGDNTDPSTYFDSSGGLDAGSYAPIPVFDPYNLNSGPLLAIPASQPSSTITIGTSSGAPIGTVSTSTPSLLSQLFGALAPVAGAATTAALTPGMTAAQQQAALAAQQAGTIAGIPTSYFLYGGIALVVVLLIAKKR